MAGKSSPHRLTNTFKYARARKFETRLRYKAKELRLELRDDGDGFKVKELLLPRSQLYQQLFRQRPVVGA